MACPTATTPARTHGVPGWSTPSAVLPPSCPPSPAPRLRPAAVAGTPVAVAAATAVAVTAAAQAPTEQHGERAPAAAAARSPFARPVRLRNRGVYAAATLLVDALCAHARK